VEEPDLSFAISLAADLPVDDFRRIRDVFRADAADLLARLETAAGAGDVDAFRRAAHTLTGAAGALGLQPLSARARDAMGATTNLGPQADMLRGLANTAIAALDALPLGTGSLGAGP
jgi:HPt (histidine-containing phosphotransfer) domain-containing protein